MERATELSVFIQVNFSGMETLLCLFMHDLSRQGTVLPHICCCPALYSTYSPFQQVLEEC